MFYLLVTGAREWDDAMFIWNVLDEFKKKHGHNLVVIQGGCRGVDQHAKNWADHTKTDFVTHWAHWDVHGKSAGPIRNRLQFDLYPVNFVLGFHPNINQSAGTAHMIRYAKEKFSAGPGMVGYGNKIMVLTGKEDICDLSLP